MIDHANQPAPKSWHQHTPMPHSASAWREESGDCATRACTDGTAAGRSPSWFHPVNAGPVKPLPNTALICGTEGFVVTFAGFAGHALVAKPLEADRANLARSQFLVAVSRDTDRRLQALIVLHELLRETVEGGEARDLLTRLDQKLPMLSGLLGTLIDTRPSDADATEASTAIFPISDAPAPEQAPARDASIHGGDLPPRPHAVAYVVDDNPGIRSTLKGLLESHALAVEVFASAEAFLESYRPGSGGCLLLDAHLPGMSGLALLGTLRGRGDHLPTILISGRRDVGLAVDAMRSGACDFLEKPLGRGNLLASITRAIDGSHSIRLADAAQQDAAARVAALTARQHEILDLVLAGNPSKNIAADLGISQRTVENHRAAIMRKMRVKSLPELARKAQSAEAHPIRGSVRKPVPAPAADVLLHA